MARPRARHYHHDPEAARAGSPSRSLSARNTREYARCRLSLDVCLILVIFCSVCRAAQERVQPSLAGQLLLNPVMQLQTEMLKQHQQTQVGHPVRLPIALAHIDARSCSRSQQHAQVMLQALASSQPLVAVGLALQNGLPLPVLPPLPDQQRQAVLELHARQLLAKVWLIPCCLPHHRSSRVAAFTGQDPGTDSSAPIRAGA